MSDKPIRPGVGFNEFLKMVENPDGTMTRLMTFPTAPATPDNNNPNVHVLSKDITLNHKNNTWVRIYLPRQALNHSSSSVTDGGATTKLPIIVYYHGGGFIICSAATTVFHDFCAEMASNLPAIIISVEYRLAPEHRLPAAYNDAVEALHWIKNSDEKWLKDHADISRCFLMGSSAGANIAYYAGVNVADDVDDLKPLRIKGFILHQPFFGGTQRTGSEMRLANDNILPLCATDLMWELGLPIGVDRDHEYCNPMVGKAGSEQCEKIGKMGWSFLLTGCDGDLLIDQQVAFAKMLEEKGITTKAEFVEGNYHMVELFDPPRGKAFCGLVKGYIFPSATA